MVRGQTLLCSLAYFHRVDVNAVKRVRAKARMANHDASPEEEALAASIALEMRAEWLHKLPDQLTDAERLDVSAVQFKSFLGLYQPGLGRIVSRHGMDGCEADAIWKKLPDPRQYFSTQLLVFPDRGDGYVDVRATKAGRWKLVPWCFRPRTYKALWQLSDNLRQNEMSIATQVIRLRCDSTVPERISVSLASKSAWQESDDLRAEILNKAVRYYPTLIPYRQISTEYLRRALGLSE
jgi:hypothetical protein